jgi:hypothetical protein
MEVWDPNDSPPTAEAFRNDYIDCIHVFALEHPEQVVHSYYRTPKKSAFGKISKY